MFTISIAYSRNISTKNRLLCYHYRCIVSFLRFVNVIVYTNRISISCLYNQWRSLIIFFVYNECAQLCMVYLFALLLLLSKCVAIDIITHSQHSKNYQCDSQWMCYAERYLSILTRYLSSCT